MSMRHYSLAFAVLLFCSTTTVHGATRFVTGTTVSSDEGVAVMTVQFACKVEYVSHLPVNRGNRLRVQIDPTTICSGVAPSAARTQEQFRPINADAANLLEIDYDGAVSAVPTLTFNFSHVVRYEVSYSGGQNRIIVRVHADEVVAAPPPPSSGGAHVIELLNIMENFDLKKLGLNSTESIHAWAEAMKLMYADRAKYMADTDFVDVPLKGLTSKQYARGQFELIDMNSVISQETAGDPWPAESGSTTHFSVVDSDGNMVAYTKTINHFFASGITATGTGILLNDQMDDFDKRPGQANSIEGGKKPLSSMSPTLLLRDGKPFATIGSPGGKRIISTMAMLISNLVDYNMDIQSAIMVPRINNYEVGPLKIEARIPIEVQNELLQMGHELDVKKDFDLYFGGAQGVVIDQRTGKLHGGADPRRDGKAIGY